MKYYSANRIHNGYAFLPENTVVVLNEKREVEDVLSADKVDRNRIEFLEGILCPGFVNTHCHLELSYLKGKLTEKKGLHEFIREIESLKKSEDEEMYDAVAKADAEMYANGIVACGDICNTRVTFPAKLQSKIYYHNFFEVYAFDPQKAEQALDRGMKLSVEWEKISEKSGRNYSITPHAPYSASVKLLHLISDYAADHESILTIHMQESADDDLLFRNKSGKILDRLKGFGIDTEHFSATGAGALQSSLIHLPRDQKILLVHNTYLSKDDIEFAEEYSREIYFCLCPRANLYIENRLPDFKLFKTDHKITLGTDSLASNYNLSIYDEIKSIQRNSSVFTLEELLRFATSSGAEYLGIDDWAGSLRRGMKPGLVLINEKSADAIRRII